jgi:hypothetical protein
MAELGMTMAKTAAVTPGGGRTGQERAQSRLPISSHDQDRALSWPPVGNHDDGRIVSRLPVDNHDKTGPCHACRSTTMTIPSLVTFAGRQP